MTKIEDFFVDYTFEQTDTNIQSAVSSNYEFAKYKAKVVETLDANKPPPQFFNHQKLIGKLMDLYPRLLLIHEPGVGKTGSAINVCERARRTGLFTQAVILEKGKSLFQDIKNQIAFKFTKRGTYDKEAFYEAETDKERRFILTKEINKFYTFMSYTTFSNNVKTKPDSEIYNLYSGTVFFIDEAHNLTNESEVLSPLAEAIMRVLSIAIRTKVVLATATPMINSSKELLPLLNFILPPERKFPLNYPINNITFNEFYDRCAGFISYVRAERNKIKTVDMGVKTTFLDVNQQPPPPNFPIEAVPILYHSTMSETQYSVYRKYAPFIGDAGTYFIKAFQAASFVFPNGSISGKVTNDSVDEGFVIDDDKKMLNGLEEYVEPNQKYPDRFKFRKSPKNNLEKWLVENNNTSNLAKLSCKFAAVLDIELAKINTEGTVFIYSESKNGGGAILLSLIMEVFGYDRFYPEDWMGRSHKLIPKKLRHALIISETSVQKQDEILKVFNSPENIDGDLIKVLIGSKATRDGINISHCVRVHILFPGWTESGIIQATSRALRATSHDLLFARRKQELTNEANRNGWTEDELNRRARITVEIYKHAAVVPKAFIQTVSSIDILAYQRSAIKNVEIHKLLRFLKRSAIDCSLTYDRNVTYPYNEGIISDGCAECDFQQCKYICGKTPKINKTINYKNHNIKSLTNLNNTEEVLKFLVEYISSVKTIEIDKILANAPSSFSQMSIYNCLLKLINTGVSIKNYLNESCVLSCSHDGTLFLNKYINTTLGSNSKFMFFSDFFETSSKYYVIKSNLRNSIYNLYKNEQTEIEKIKDIKTIPTVISLVYLVKILEDMILTSYHKQWKYNKEDIQYLFNIFSKYIGLHEFNDKQYFFHKIFCNDANDIFGMYSSNIDEKNKLIRVLDDECKIWRFAIPEEIEIITQNITKESSTVNIISSTILHNKEVGIKGFIQNDEFIIIDERGDPEVVAKRKGKRCSSYPTPELLEIAQLLTKTQKLTLDVIAEELGITDLNSLSLSKDIYNLKYIKRAYLCNYIQKRLEQE